MDSAAATAFSVAFDAQGRRLLGCWHTPTTDATLRAHYAELLAAAQAHGNCRYWLLDLRGRDWHSAEFGRWFTHEYAPQVHATLGQPVFLAYVLSPAHYTAVDAPSAHALQVGCVEHDLYTYYFDNAPDALAWLEHQQAFDGAAG